MWRLLVFVFFWTVVGVICLGVSNNVKALSEDSWLEGSITKRSEVESRALNDDEKTCNGRASLIEVKGESLAKEGCVFGDPQGVKVARYRQANNQFAYGIAFSSDASFMKINNLCTGLANCLYSQVDDTFLMQYPFGNGLALKYIKNFTKYLKRDSSYYHFDSGEREAVITANQTPALTGAIGISSNGKWVLMELKEYGFAILDIKQQKYKRFSFLDFSSNTNGQSHGLAISDDGRWAVITGYTAGLHIYEVNDTCGDFLEVAHGSGATHQTIACNARVLSTGTLGAGTVSVYSPRFSGENKKLILEVQKANQTLTVTLISREIESVNSLYVAFGDSFSSGEGELNDTFYIAETNTPTNRCHVSSRSYPYLLQAAWEIKTLNLACSGAQISGVRQASQKFITGGNQRYPTVISLGIGGNDVDFMGKLKSCIGIGTCEWAKPEKRAATAEEIKALFPKLIDVINELKREYSPAGLFLVGYPEVINASPSANCSMLIGSLLNDEERRYMGESIRYLNKVLQAAANYTKITFADIENTYNGERLCDDKETAMNGVRRGDDIAPIPFIDNVKLIGAESFHPTPRGHQLAAVRIETQLEPFWRSHVCDSCIYSSSQLEPSSYWHQVGESSGPLARPIAQKFLHIEPLVSISNIAFNFLPNFFSPSSNVKFELHSEVKQLGTFTTSEDGSLEGELRLPGGIEGYHTVHAYGESRSGEVIDAYQTVYIDTTGVSDAERTIAQDNTAVGLEYSPYSSILTRYGASREPQVEYKAKVLNKQISKKQSADWRILVAVIGCILVFALPFIIFKIRQSLSGP